MHLSVELYRTHSSNLNIKIDLIFRESELFIVTVHTYNTYDINLNNIDCLACAPISELPSHICTVDWEAEYFLMKEEGLRTPWRVPQSYDTSLQIMVLISEGKSEIGAHVGSNLC